MSEHVCRCNLAEPHTTFGQCMRSKSIGFVGCFPTKSVGAGRGDAMAQKKWDKELNAYESARKQGVQPAGTQMHQIENALKVSDKYGKAWDASAGRLV